MFVVLSFVVLFVISAAFRCKYGSIFHVTNDLIGCYQRASGGEGGRAGERGVLARNCIRHLPLLVGKASSDVVLYAI